MTATVKLKSNNIAIVCRACLKIDKNRFNIFEHSHNKKFISELLMECTPVKVQKDDGFPANICSNCLEKLNYVLDFREMVVLSSSKLQNFYQAEVLEMVKDEEGDSSSVPIKEESLKTESNDRLNNLSDNSVYKCVAELDISENESRSNNNNQNSPSTQLTLQNSTNKEKRPKNDKSSVSVISNNENRCTGLIKDECKSENVEQTESIRHEDMNKELTHLKNVARLKAVRSNVKNRIPSQDESTDDSGADSPFSNHSSSDSECDDVNDSNKHLILDGDERKDKNTFNWIEKHMDILDNPDCKRIISMGLSKKEKDRATVFCKVCGKTVNFRYYVQVHAQTHMGNIPFKCEKCGKSFAQRHILNQHIRAVHEKTIKLSCDICGKGFTSPSIMLQHKAKHSDAKPYKCDTCGKGFKLSGTLKKHYVVHRNDKQFTCELCGKSFLEKNNLREHILSHVTEKNFNCTLCPKSFTTKRGLDTHLKRHSGNRPFVCSYCGKTFTVSSVLRKHILIHTGAKPYSCKICDRKFTQDSSLRYHMRIHTGEKPYSCGSCSISFRYKHLLKNHMNRLHKSNVTEELKS